MRMHFVPGLLALAAFGCATVTLAAGSTAAKTAKTGGANVSAMLAQQGCTGCHADKTKVVGPAWGWVAYRFRSTPKQQAVNEVASFIISGGTGYWKSWTGGIPMPAHPNISKQQADTIASWILAQAPIAPPKP